jgi:MinD-like ATPase involved in chromosome partitioning or flagellar assembly
MAVLGDSDSHAFQDQISFPPGDPARGGPYRAVSLQWTEVVSRLRGAELDPGDWGVWGMRGRWARLPRVFGATPRVPKKQDHRFNFAWSGARCADLDEGIAEQLSPLLALMAEAPEAWSRGVVVLRIGINDLGVHQALDAFAAGDATAESEALVDACVAHIGHTVSAITAAHPSTAIVLVGVLDNTEWPDLDYLIVDLPPGTGDVPLTLCQLLPLTGAVVVATPQQVALDDALRAVKMFQQLGAPVLGVVENMSCFVAPDGTRHDIFGHGGAALMARTLDLPFLGDIPMFPELRINSDAGKPHANFEHTAELREALENVARNLAGQVSLRNLGAPEAQLEIS